ncbi:MAG TPA: Gfo/Idh/MocA family oxidoreductase [Planctomycetota bacterium]|nr:Gfo/Idh/MocA family oxidoreductase [Planctomycetota bacterium]
MLRRNFLTGLSATGAAAALSPTLLRADDTHTPASPRDIARIAIFGVRGRGADHMKEFAAMKDVQVVAIADPDENVIGKAMKLAAEHEQKPRYEKDLRKVLDDKNVDAVIIATPNHWHSLAAILSLQAGKHVYCEKPVSQNHWEGARMVEAARKYNRVCMTGTQNRSGASNAAGIAYMQAGKLGKIKIGRGIVYRARKNIGNKQDAPVPAGVDYNIWQGAAHEHPFNPNRFHYEWHWNWEYGNGELGNNGIHALDVVRWGLGKNELPHRVLSLGGRYGFDHDDGQTPNTHVVWYDYGDCQMVCELRNLATEEYNPTKPDVVFHCEHGILAKAGGSKMTAYDLKWNKIEEFTGGNNHYRRFTDAVKKGSLDDPGNFILEGHLSTSICHLGNISHRVGEELPFEGVESTIKENEALSDAYARMVEHLKKNNIDLKAEKLTVGKLLEFDNKTEAFIGDAKATALLRREYRAPFVVPEKV